MRKRIIVLTKSNKHTGHCIAGIDYETGEWIRLLSDNHKTEGAVPAEQLIYQDGSRLQIYDIIECELIKPIPTMVQPENWLYDVNVSWKKIGVSDKEEVIELHGFDAPEYVFENTEKSLGANTYFTGKPSLLLLEVTQAYYAIQSFSERTLVQLNFVYNNRRYSFFKITQREIKNEYSQKPTGNYRISQPCVAVFSLTDQYKDGKYYKVVAQILE